MSAPRASETPSTANSLARDPVASLRTVQVPGSTATYANRATLREIGLRWDPAGHRWHGTTTADRVKELRERLGLEVRCFGDLEAAPKGPAAPKPVPPGPAPLPTTIRSEPQDPACRPHDGLQTNPSGSSHPRSFVPGTRTRVEARLAFPSIEEKEEIPMPTRRFTVMEITSGLPDDSREADEKEAERRLRDLRGRVKAARAVASTTPGLVKTLQSDWRTAARFYARYGITEESFRHGALVSRTSIEVDPAERRPFLDHNLTPSKKIIQSGIAFETI